MLPISFDFIQQVVKNPKEMAGIQPSGSALGAAMAAAVDVHSKFIVELGPGTGAITHRLIARFPDAHILAVEANEVLGRKLRKSMPWVSTAIADARYLPSLVGEFGFKQVPVIVSSLGLRNMDIDTQRVLFKGIDTALSPGGIFVQYTYGRRQPIDDAVLKGLGWRPQALGLVLANLPPARVWRYRKD